MSNDNDNRRKNDRFQAFWKVYRQNISWGYLVDLSETGIRVWLNKEEVLKDNNFIIRIRPPKELNIQEMDLDVSKVWTNPDKSNRFNEIGCTFNNLSTDKVKYINQLIVYFKKYNLSENV